MVDFMSLKRTLKEKATSNPEILAELKKAGITSPTELDSMSSQQLKSVLSPKLMGMLGYSMDDLDRS